MFKKEFIIQAHKVIDVLLTCLAFLAVYFIKQHMMPQSVRGLTETIDYYFVLLLIVVIWYIGFSASGIHAKYIKYPNWVRLGIDLSKLVTINTGVLILVLYLLKIKDLSRLMIVMFVALDIAALAYSAYLSNSLFKRRRLSNILIVIIGSKEAAREFIECVLSEPDCRYQVLGCLDLDKEDIGKVVARNIKVVGTLDELQYFLSNQVVDELIFAAPIDRIWEAEQYFATAEAVGVQIRILPHWHLRKFLAIRPKFYSIHFEEIIDNPTLLLRPTRATQTALVLKTCFDYAFGATVLMLLLPLLLIIACAIKIISPGPVLFKQERCTLYGRRFTFYKFRTMVVGADEMRDGLMAMNEGAGPTFKMERDPRIIPYIGHFLRKSSLDELPNLINVLRGEMSIVGPRPPTPDEVERYALWERRRLSMKPGLTCIWQTSPRRNSVPFGEWMRMDLEYIDGWSLWLDVKIMFRTLRAVFYGYGM
ncbi:MAG: sugar transferase [Acidobacteriota bacterium]